jgi:CheY-like chemotaxis protein
MTKIMLVEDDRSLKEIYSIRLVAEGYDIVSANDGEEALAMIVREHPDLIVTDVMMPKISGFDMLDIIRSTPEVKDTKVIVMTALGGDDQRHRGENLGADRYLVKSQVGIEDVVNVVHEVLGDRNKPPVVTAPLPAATQPQPTQTVLTPNSAQQAADKAAPAPTEPTPGPTPAPPAATPAPVIPEPVATPVPAAPAPTAEPTAPNPAVTNVNPSPSPSPSPSPAPAAETTPKGGGEKVIQPIDNPNAKEQEDKLAEQLDQELAADAPPAASPFTPPAGSGQFAPAPPPDPALAVIPTPPPVVVSEPVTPTPTPPTDDLPITQPTENPLEQPPAPASPPVAPAQ